ncbi:hypothetical protein C7Q67_14150 [Staphylococcus aureus]|nr:hypothetical protein C7Q67_14150 [Staphylococcus aureus]
MKNNWIDTEGNIYFIYTVADLEVILNCGNKKITKTKIKEAKFKTIIKLYEYQRTLENKTEC